MSGSLGYSSLNIHCLVCFYALTWFKTVSSVGCFECNSQNGSAALCEDPFHPAWGKLYRVNCMAGIPGRAGEFPTRYCVKITGVERDTGESIMIRRCSVEAFGSQCGMFKFDGHEYDGCIATCETDGCNSARALTVHPYLFFWTISFIWLRMNDFTLDDS